MAKYLIFCILPIVLCGCSATQSASKSTNAKKTTSSGGGLSSSQTQPQAGELPDEESSDPAMSGATPTPTPTPKDKLKFGGAIYTTQQPGSYAEIAGAHASQLSFSGRILSVTISHEQIKTHYTKWIQVRTVAGDVLSEKLVAAPENTYPTTQTVEPTTIDLNGADLKKDQLLYVYSSCGEHGIWRSEIKVP